MRCACLCWSISRSLRRRPASLLGSSVFSSDASKDDGNSGITVSIDRSGLFNPQLHSHDLQPQKEPETALAKQLKALIREALINPEHGYYMRKDVFGQAGDFITSPEISQLFGEWQKLGSPKKLRIVELGPGRGTLMADLLRGMAPMKGFSSSIRVHFVEVSEALRKVQRETLSCNSPREWSQKHKDRTLSAVSSISNVQVNWHKSLAEVPEDIPAIYLAHEFFDALPAHQFVRTERGWCERLVDIAGPESSHHLRLVLSPGATPASSLLVKKRLEAMSPEESEQVKQIEISAASISAAETLAQRIARHKGAALIVDYGKDVHFDASIQAIRNHKFVHLLARPGEADLSCRVDFAALRQGVLQSNSNVNSHGPIPQAYFLAGLGIEARLDSLLSKSTEEEQDHLIRGYNRIVGGEEERVQTSAPPATVTAAEEKRPGEKVAAELESLSEKMRGAPEEEGMGYSYKVMAITNADQSPPEPFAGSGVEFK